MLVDTSQIISRSFFSYSASFSNEHQTILQLYEKQIWNFRIYYDMKTKQSLVSLVFSVPRGSTANVSAITTQVTTFRASLGCWLSHVCIYIYTHRDIHIITYFIGRYCTRYFSNTVFSLVISLFSSKYNKNWIFPKYYCCEIK